MAKLTDAQKAENKAARKLRDQAYNARRKVYAEKRKAAVAVVENGPLATEAQLADKICRDAMAALDAEKKELRAKIKAIEAEIDALSIKHNIDEVNQKRRETGDAFYAAKRAADKAVDAEFPDMVGIWTAAEWEHKGHYTPAGQS